MKLLVVVFLLTCCFLLIDADDSSFESFAKLHKKKYKTQEERLKRSKIFSENLRKLEELNKNSKHAEYKMNQFFDLSSEEFAKMYNGLIPLANSKSQQGQNLGLSITSTTKPTTKATTKSTTKATTKATTKVTTKARPNDKTKARTKAKKSISS